MNSAIQIEAIHLVAEVLVLFKGRGLKVLLCQVLISWKSDILDTVRFSPDDGTVCLCYVYVYVYACLYKN